MKLFLKGERCYTEKCAMERRPYPPGMAGQGRKKFSEYGMQLREKQKVRRLYGVLEKQFRKYYKQASRMKGVTGETLLQLLERRLDNVVYRLGFAESRAEARVLVGQGHFAVDGRRVNIPSYRVSPGMVITVRDKSKEKTKFQATVQNAEKRGTPGWLTLDAKALSGTVDAMPSREDITLPIQEQLIVELYSK